VTPLLTLARPIPDIDWRWVEAAPFRAQLHQLLAETGLPWRALAGETGVPDRVVRSLLHGQEGRAVRRIAPHYARRLLRMNAEDLSGALRELTTAEPSHAAAHLLLGSNWSVPQIAAMAELTEAETEALLMGRVTCIPRRVQALLSAAVRAHQLDADRLDPFGDASTLAAA
jgi:hypothetical protein